MQSLVSKSKNIQLELNIAQENLTAAKNDCVDAGGLSACNDIPVGDKLTTEANFTKVHVPLTVLVAQHCSFC